MNSDFSYTATAIGQKSCMKTGEIRLQTKLTSLHALTYMCTLFTGAENANMCMTFLTVSNNKDSKGDPTAQSTGKNSLVT